MDAVELLAQLIELLNQARVEQQAMIDSLSPQQRAAEGTPEHWSAKDVVAHVASWWRIQVERERALMAGQPVPPIDDAEINRRNALLVEQSRPHSWAQVNTEAQNAHDALVATLRGIEPQRLVNTIIAGRQAWRSVLGNGFLHPQTHLAEYYRDQGDAAGASQIIEHSAELLLRYLPIPAVQGMALYNIACAYATTGRPAEAIARLHAAFPLDPELVEWSHHDSDLDSLRALPAFKALYPTSRSSR
jgi:tetratricopeptide (TPR) repeat protein